MGASCSRSVTEHVLLVHQAVCLLTSALPDERLMLLVYREALDWMESVRDSMIADPNQSGQLMLCQHPPTITCGKHSQKAHVLLSEEARTRAGIALEYIERGGDVTYHGPGQLMIYPVVRVGIHISVFLETLADALAELAMGYGVEGATWQKTDAGLWLKGRKLAACGLHLRRGVSIHGFALNVCTPAADWNCIVPCGLSGPPPVSLHEAMGDRDGRPSVEQCAQRLRPILERVLMPYGLDS